MTADTPSPSEVVEKLTALRVMCESCNQPLYVEILDEVLSALSTRSSIVDEATVGWQPIETAPKDGTVVDLWARGDRHANCFWETSDWVDEPHWRQHYSEAPGSDFPLDLDPTHWRPLPEPPASLPSVAVQPIGEGTQIP